MKIILLLFAIVLPVILPAAELADEQATAESILLDPDERATIQEAIVDWLNFFVNDILFHPLVVIILGLFGVSFAHPGVRRMGGTALEKTGMKKPKQPDE